MWIPSSQMACSHAMADRERSLFLVVGLPAAGKSTVGGLLARRFERGVHVEGDFFKRMIVSGRAKPARTPSDEWWSQMRLRCRMGAAVADSCLAAGFTVVAQDLVIGPLLSEYVGFIRSRPLLVVVLAPRAEVLAAREGARELLGPALVGMRDADPLAVDEIAAEVRRADRDGVPGPGTTFRARARIAATKKVRCRKQ